MNAEKGPTSIDEINTTTEKRLDQQYEAFERLVKNEKEYMFLMSRRYIKMLRRALAFSRIIDGTVFDEHNIMKTKKGYLDGMLYNFDIPLKFVEYLQNIIFIGIEPQKDRLECFYKMEYNDSTQTEDLIQLDSGNPMDNNVHKSGNQTRTKMGNEEPMDDTVNESVNQIQPERRNEELGNTLERATVIQQNSANLNQQQIPVLNNPIAGGFNIENDNTKLKNLDVSNLRHPTVSKLKKLDDSNLKHTAALRLKYLHANGIISEEAIAEKLNDPNATGFNTQATAVLNYPNATGFDGPNATAGFDDPNAATGFDAQATAVLNDPTTSKLKKSDILKLKYTTALKLKELHEQGKLSEESIIETLEKLEKAVNSGVKKSKETAAFSLPSIDDLGLKDLNILKRKRTQEHHLKGYRSMEDLDTYAKQGPIYEQEQSQDHQENEPLIGATGFSGLEPREEQQIESDLTDQPFILVIYLSLPCNDPLNLSINNTYKSIKKIIA
ncbi:hypothetical protein AVEN_10191-1 [Araneus ventricosus]|uniref:Uncharacterized protein n=1 Tax=Araneus ventricosus TaxID=182803 RepID=A0A4Y2HDU2_ARAVE|nr:hypothetical protein AVEN_10191-1 [Araneus ventricosus]